WPLDWKNLSHIARSSSEVVGLTLMVADAPFQNRQKIGKLGKKHRKAPDRSGTNRRCHSRYHSDWRGWPRPLLPGNGGETRPALLRSGRPLGGRFPRAPAPAFHPLPARFGVLRAVLFRLIAFVTIGPIIPPARAV